MSLNMSMRGGNNKSSVDYHNKTTYANLERGDLIQFHRGLYSHWAVYIGDDEVVHLAGVDNDGLNGNVRPEHMFTISGKIYAKAEVCIDRLWDVALGSKMYINNSKDKNLRSFTPDEIVRNALSKLGQVGYNVITQNCEHFAKWCRYGVEKSDQVDNALTGVAVGAAAVAVVGLVHAITKYWNPEKAQKADDEDDD